MSLARSFRIPALFCAFSVLLCELIAHPSANMSVCDDGPYILMAQHLAATGHIVYNGGAAAMLGWQLYLGAAFIRLFGFSFTAVRSSTILVAMVVAFLLQRIMVRSGITERNATLGTLALVLSPLYLMLAATFMTDITGLFAVVVCLYACIRALQASTTRTTIAWLCFAIATNAVCGTSRQIAWLGLLVIVPSTLWLLRSQRRVLFAGLSAILAGLLFLFACMRWFSHQPYILPEPLLPKSFPLAHTLGTLATFYLDLPFLLLSLTALFLPQLWCQPRTLQSSTLRPRTLALLALASAAYLFLATYPSHLRGDFPLEPLLHNGNWVSVHGIYEGVISLSGWQSQTPIFLNTPVRILLTILSIGGLLGLLVSLRRTCKTPTPTTSAAPQPALPWHALTLLLAPFTLASALLLIPRSTGLLFDRYALEFLLVAAILLVRYYQDRIHPSLPFATTLLIAIMALYAIAVTHNTFSLDRARVALAAELNAHGIPDTAVDNGWEYNFDVEIQQAGYINDARILLPAHAYTPTPPPPPGICPMLFADDTPHIHPLYGVSFQPNVCNGPAPFAPVHYSRWLAASPGTLYAVRYTPSSKP